MSMKCRVYEIIIYPKFDVILTRTPRYRLAFGGLDQPNDIDVPDCRLGRILS